MSHTEAITHLSQIITYSVMRKVIKAQRRINTVATALGEKAHLRTK